MQAAEVFDLLSALVDKSLLQIDDAAGDGARYRMLETIREYGLDRAEETGELARHPRGPRALLPGAGRGRPTRTCAGPTRSPGNDACTPSTTTCWRRCATSATAATHGPRAPWSWRCCGSGCCRAPAAMRCWRGWSSRVRLPGEADPLDRVMIDAVHAPAPTSCPASPARAIPSPADGRARADRRRGPHPPPAAGGGAADAGRRGRPRAHARAAGALGAPSRSRGSARRRRSSASRSPRTRAISRRCAPHSTSRWRRFGEVGDRWGLGTTLAELAGLRILEGDLDGAESALEQIAVADGRTRGRATTTS